MSTYSPVNTFEEYKETRLTTMERKKIEILASIIKEIVLLRKENGITQKELAELSNKKQSEISRLENMKVTPTIDTLLDVLHPLGYSLELVPLESVDKRELINA